MLPLLTQRAMAMWRDPTQKSLRVSRFALMMAQRSMAGGGSMSFRAHCGEIGHHQAEPLGRCHSSWYTGLRPSSPQKSPWPPNVSRHKTKPCKTSSSMKISTSLMTEDGNLLSKMHGTVRHSNATKSGSCVAESSSGRSGCPAGAHSRGC
jgi:hypothetical protein